jgi:hypothetical protein|nr:MAG TPA: hypothetical protein [Caudoviricetes sp.]
MDISRITFNGVEYQIKDNEAQTLINQLLNRIAELEDKTADVKESEAFNEGNIFVGVMDETDKDTPITYSYLTALLKKDGNNNKVFANTDKPITVRTYWRYGEGNYGKVLKTFFILVPATHKNLYSLSAGCQNFVGWDDEYTVVTIDFPTGAKQYKLFRFANWLSSCSSDVTYKF